MLIALSLSSSNAGLLGRTESSEGPDIDRSKWERDLSQRSFEKLEHRGEMVSCGLKSMEVVC